MIMRSNKKLALALCCLASTAVFSTASISTNYQYKETNVSTLVCQPFADMDSMSSSLRYTDIGLFNSSKNNTVSIACPVITASLDTPTNTKVTYNIRMVARGANENVAGRLTCTLSEVISVNRNKKQRLTRSTEIYGTTPKSLNWVGVKKLTGTQDSAFTLTCKVPPKVGLANITVDRR